MNQERILTLGALISGLMLLLVGTWVFTRPAPLVLRDYGTLPAFTLADQNGKLFDSSNLQGKVWVASFIDANVTSTSQVMVSMLDIYLATEKEKDFQIVSMSLDPALDTPKRLIQYSGTLDVAESRWIFLTGNQVYIKDLVSNGFKRKTDRGDGKNQKEIMHPADVVLVDAQGEIRGYFDVASDMGPGEIELRRAIKQLLSKENGG